MNLSTQRNLNIRLLKNVIFTKLSGLLVKAKSELTEDEEFKEVEELIKCIKDAKKEWISATANFEHATDSEIIDYYTYEIKAYQLRYEYLLKKAKEKGIKVNEDSIIV
ncbi:MAG TPA: YaaL family protein [Acetivibrio sp.]|uniref:YaaL family protein n=1 Tax=Acetivibrio sp. TaxID=1872092 RepID=UPI002C617033|nr:YaaL family protein [Acetivibrio sp.]HOM03469.1 YaaL family protein [Acetivibrio sp.]